MQEWEKLDEEGCERLIAAIIRLAMNDYKAALKQLKRDPNSQGAKREIIKLRIFFRSSYYEKLCSMPGNQVIRMLEEGFDVKM